MGSCLADGLVFMAFLPLSAFTSGDPGFALDGAAAVPGAPASVLASIGFAAVLAAERRRRKLARLKQGADAFYYLVKRLIDILLSFGLLLAFLPVLITIAVLVRMDSPGPIFFRRKVIGKNGRSFDMFKFRSMVTNADEILERDPALWAEYSKNFKLSIDPRVTHLGLFLRKTSLDELPQLANVLLGTMTFVGPRPIHEDEVVLYGSDIERFKIVKPGITGLWQTSGRSDTCYEVRVSMDMQYISQRCIAMDLAIILRTIPAVLTRRGAC